MTASAPQMSQGVDPRLEAAHKRLSETGSQAEAFEAIREIVTNLLGCEEMGIFAPVDGNSKLLWSFGIDTQRYTSLEGFEKSAMRQVKSGECHIAQVAGEDDSTPSGSLPQASIPILLDGRTVAVLVMLRLLPQKIGLDESDLRLVKLLSAEAGRPLFAQCQRQTLGQAGSKG
jgi:hypothetical protein